MMVESVVEAQNMFTDEPVLEQTDADVAERDVFEMRAETRGAVARGAVDVLTFRALIFVAQRLWVRSPAAKDEGDLNEAIIRVINTNGALAKALLDVTR